MDADHSIVDLDTQKIHVLAELSCFDTVQKMLLQDGVLYLLGTKKYSVTPYQPDGAGGYSFYGDQIISYRISDGTFGAVDVNYPISMTLAENGRLVVYAYQKAAYGLLEYDPAQASVQTLAKFSSYFMQDFAVCHGGKDIIYSYSHNSRGLVLAPLDAMNQETELSSQSPPRAAFWQSFTPCTKMGKLRLASIKMCIQKEWRMYLTERRMWRNISGKPSRN